MFENFENEAREFVEQVANELNEPDRDAALRVMKGVLHTIRDVITVEESLHFISQLPLFVKGVYVSDWHLSKRKGLTDVSSLTEHMRSDSQRTGARDFGDDETALEKFKAVMRVIRRKVSPGMIDNIVAEFPAELKELWHDSRIAAGTPM
jgi:uncharacterized protein (DUF2267 family)